jgi:hypothetical protein
VKWGFSYKKIKIKRYFDLWKLSQIESKHTQVDLKSLVSPSPHTMRIRMRCHIWPMDAQRIRRSCGPGVLIIDFVRWMCYPWAAFGHWRTYLTRCMWWTHEFKDYQRVLKSDPQGLTICPLLPINRTHYKLRFGQKLQPNPCGDGWKHTTQETSDLASHASSNLESD